VSTAFKYNHYVPILKAKAGEFTALKNLSNEAKGKITPLIDIPRINQFRNPEPLTLEEHLSKVIKEIEDSCDGIGCYFVDLFDLKLDLRIGGNIHPVTYVFGGIRKCGQLAVPTIGLERDDAYIHAVREVVKTDKRGVCVRLLGEDMESIEELEDQLDELLDDIGIKRPDVHLLLDNRSIFNSSFEKVAQTIIDVLNSLSDIHSWKTITVASGGIPNSISDVVKPRNNGEVFRVGYCLWQALLNRRSEIARIPSYGDYGISPPDMVDLDPRLISGTMGPKIIYADSDRWLIFRGERFKTSGYDQYHSLAQQVVSHPSFSGEQFSYGDTKIFLKANRDEGPGNPYQWVGISANHHITFVAHQIKSAS